MKIIYSYNKPGYEGDETAKGISAASNSKFTFLPFNHQKYLNPVRYASAADLDSLYHAKCPELMKLYSDFLDYIRQTKADAVIVTNCPPYHPDFLKNIPIYKALYSTDDPGATYLVNIPYLHAYDHVFYADPAYSQDMDMHAKMTYCGMKNADWLPIGVHDFECDSSLNEEAIFNLNRDIDVIYVGKFWRQKIPAILALKKALGKRFRFHGLLNLKHNLYLNLRHGYGEWVSPISLKERVLLYQRAKIGVNIHWNEYGLGNQRLYHLPANGVMQISDCASSLGAIFTENAEVASYRSIPEMIDKVMYFLNHDDERLNIAKNAYRRVMREYLFSKVLLRAGALVAKGMRDNKES